MQATKLTAQVREITGKKVKKLRREGFVPVNVYGKGVVSQALQVPLKEFQEIYSKVGETGLVELTYGKTTNHVLVKNVQFNPILRTAIHGEFHAVNLKEKIKANIPLELVGEAAAITNGVGILLQAINEVEVEALPTELPDRFEVNVEKLAEIDQQIVVSELMAPNGVEILTAGEEVVVKVVKAVVEEVEEPVVSSEEGEAGTGDDGVKDENKTDEQVEEKKEG